MGPQVQLHFTQLQSSSKLRTGTGKTFTVHAIANHLGKKSLLVNFEMLAQRHGGQHLTFKLNLPFDVLFAPTAMCPLCPSACYCSAALTDAARCVQE